MKKDKKEIKILEEIGLTQGQAKVYLALLNLGASTTGKIITKAKVSRSKVYEMLDSLIEKGIVSYVIKENAKYFEAENPEQILNYLQKKKKNLQKKEQDFKSILPRLKTIQTSREIKQTANVYEGIKGIKTIYSNIIATLKRGDEYYVVGVEPELYKSISFTSFILNLHKERVKKGIKVKLIAYTRSELNEGIAKTKLSEVRYTDKNIPAATLIYGNNVATFVWGENPVGVVTTSPIITKRYKEFFKGVWKNAKKVIE